MLNKSLINCIYNSYQIEASQLHKDHNVACNITHVMDQYGLVSKSYNESSITMYHLIKISILVFKE